MTRIFMVGNNYVADNDSYGQLSPTQEIEIIEKINQDGHLDEIKALLNQAQGFNLNTIFQCGNTLLHVAVQSNRLDVVQELISRGANVGIEDNSQCTPLYYAAQEGNTDMISFLLEQGANCNMRSNYVNPSSPLGVALEKGHVEVALHLLNEGEINFNIISIEEVLNIVLKKNHISVLHFLLDNRIINPNRVNDRNQNIVQLAVICDSNLDVVQFLIEEYKINQHLFHFLSEFKQDLDAVCMFNWINQNSQRLEIQLNINEMDQYGCTALELAVMSDKINLVRALIAAGANPQILNDEEQTLFHLAVIKGAKVVLQSLLGSTNINLNQIDRDGYTALQLAVMGCKTHCARLLMDAGADCHILAPKGRTLLHLVAMQNEAVVLESLLRSTDININQTDEDGQTPLHLAVIRGSLAVLPILLRSTNINLNQSNKKGHTALHLAVMDGQISCLQALMGARADCHILAPKGRTLLHLAAMKGEAIVLDSLLRSTDININQTDEEGHTALQLAVMDRQISSVETLVGAGADLRILNAGGQTLLHLAVISNVVAVLNCLLGSRNIDINQRDGDGHTALQLAVRYGQTAFVETLVGAGADFRILNAERQTLLHLAVISNTEKVLKFLLGSRNIDINQRDGDGHTALHLAVKHGAGENILGYLIHLGAKLNILNRRNQNVLHLAAIHRNYVAMEQLAVISKREFNPNQQDSQGNTPLHLIIMHSPSIEDLSRYRGLMERRFRSSWDTQNEERKTPRDLAMQRGFSLTNGRA